MLRHLCLKSIICITSLFSLHNLAAAPIGKIEVAPSFVHVDILESGHTVKRMDMWAGRAEGSYELYRGLMIKGNALYSHGNAAKGGIFTAAAGLSWYLPYNEWLAVAPGAGLGYSHLWTKIDLPAYGLFDLQERFKSLSPYIGFDIYFTLTKGLRICASYQYSWSRTFTTISHLTRTKSHSQGPIYGAIIEYDIDSNWSVNLGIAYNISLSKEKHGIRGSGIKAGLAYWF